MVKPLRYVVIVMVAAIAVALLFNALMLVAPGLLPAVFFPLIFAGERSPNYDLDAELAQLLREGR